MSYIRPPFDQATASWQGALVYARPDPAAANATWQDSAVVEGFVRVLTPVQIPPVGIEIQGRVMVIAAATAFAATAAPIPEYTHRIRGHKFIPYELPPLELMLACNGAYSPRHLACPVYLDLWQPVCRVTTTTEASGVVIAPAPTPAVEVRSAVRMVQQGVARIAVPPALPPVGPAARLQQDTALGDNAHSGALFTYVPFLEKRSTGAAGGFAQGARRIVPVQAQHHRSEPLGFGCNAPHAQSQRLQRLTSAPYAAAVRRRSVTRSRSADALRTRRRAFTRHAESRRAHGHTLAGHAEYIRTHTRRHAQHQQAIAANAIGLWLILRHGRKLEAVLIAGHQQAMRPLPGRWIPGYEPPGLDLSLFCNVKYAPRDLRCPVVLSTTGIQPDCNPDQPGAETIIVPVRRTYIVINSATLTLAATGQPIQHTGLSLQLDIDSWAWGWSASVPASYLPTLRPSGPDEFVEVIATINGEPFRLLVESLQRERRFGRADLRIGGRSRSAWLSSPHAPTITRYNSESRTAQQLLEDVLTENGVSIGWDVDWQITDWLVPAGAWSHQGSYIDAAVRIAEAAGAVIQPHPTDQTLRVLHRYPDAPWEWPDATPDIALPEDVVTVEGFEWADKPRYDAVYLAGSILAHVKRAGTSGGVVAPMVTDPLITHADAGRQRGRSVLGDVGRQAQIRLALPVLEETGIIQPGTLIQYTEQGTSHRGITRAVDVQCGWPAITQTITVETHELEPV